MELGKFDSVSQPFAVPDDVLRWVLNRTRGDSNFTSVGTTVIAQIQCV
jgi:hypothetical protein